MYIRKIKCEDDLFCLFTMLMRVLFDWFLSKSKDRGIQPNLHWEGGPQLCHCQGEDPGIGAHPPPTQLRWQPEKALVC